jgi:succinate dehydrogenase / fumarate reductase cytochrome b subunit
MVTSILHRATGVVLVVGLLAMVWGLMALAGGPERWEAFAACVGSPLGQVVLFGFTWALAYHLLNGIRHLAQDAGYGWSIPEFVRSSWISVIGSLVLVVVVWGIVLARWGQA